MMCLLVLHSPTTWWREGNELQSLAVELKAASYQAVGSSQGTSKENCAGAIQRDRTQLYTSVCSSSFMQLGFVVRKVR